MTFKPGDTVKLVFVPFYWDDDDVAKFPIGTLGTIIDDADGDNQYWTEFVDRYGNLDRNFVEAEHIALAEKTFARPPWAPVKRKLSL